MAVDSKDNKTKSMYRCTLVKYKVKVILQPEYTK